MANLVTKVVRETIHTGDNTGLVTKVVRETIHGGDPNARVTKIVREVIRPFLDPAPGGPYVACMPG